MTAQRDIAAVEAEIRRTRDALENARGTETEVYARIVGYYRSVRNWNKGKRDEYNHRKQFVYGESGAHIPAVKGADCGRADELPAAKGASGSTAAATYEFYARRTCPNCPPVKEYLANSAVRGELVDVDTEAGLARAAEKGVFSAPTVILYDAAGAETARAHSVQELSAALETAAVLC